MTEDNINYETEAAPSTTPMLHIIHHTDADGHCAAAIAAKWFNDSRVVVGEDGVETETGNLFQPHEIMFHNTTYEHEDNGVGNIQKGDTVVIVDFSLRKEDMDKAVELAEDVIWIDHHDVSKLEGFDWVKGTRDMSDAACIHAWKYFYKDAPIPNVVQAIGDWDMWRHDNKEVLTFQEGLNMVDTIPANNMEFWLTVLNKPTNSEEAEAINGIIMQIMQVGSICQAYRAEQDTRALRHKFTVEVDGLKWMCINARFIGSDSFDNCTIPENVDVLCWFYLIGPNQWKHSIRLPKHRKDSDLDVSKIAATFGGGGRKDTASFVTQGPRIAEIYGAANS